MSPKATTYSFPFIMTHWLMALLIVLLLGLGWYAQTLATESTVRAFFMEVHISLVLMAYFIGTSILSGSELRLQSPASSIIKFQLMSRIAKY